MAGGPALYLFDSGSLRFGGFEAPVPFFLIRHPQGDVLVDGGNPLALARDPRAHLGSLSDHFTVSMTEDQHCAAQLQRLGVEAEDVDLVVQTHLHMDHTGALGHFPSARVVVHARELQAARGAHSESSGYVRRDFDRPELSWQLIEGDTDLFGDGTVSLLQTPGHSAGHMSLLVGLEESGPVLLTADACDTRRQWEGREPPRGLFSAEQAQRSLQRLRELAQQTGARLVVGHDAGEWARLKQDNGERWR